MNANLIYPIAPAPAQLESPSLIDLRTIWAIFRRRWRVLSASVLSVVVLAFIWVLFATPIYTATTTVLIDPRKTNAIKTDAIVSDLVLDVNTIATEVSLIKSFSVARRVAERLKLIDNPEFAQTPSRLGVARWIGALFSRPAEGDPESPATGSSKSEGATPSQPSPEMLEIIDQVEAGIDVKRLTTTYFIEVSYSHSNPELSAALANAIAESYLDEQLEARYQATQRAANWLSDRVSALRVQLEASERALAGHRAKYNLAKQQDGTLAEQQAIEINTQLVSARAETVEKKAKYDQAQRILEGGTGIENIAAVVESTDIAALRAQESEITRREADLLTRYGPEHPAILKVRAEHAEISRQIKREVSRVVQTLKSNYEFAQKKEESLESSQRELTRGQKLNDQAIIRLRELERDVESNRTLYESMLARFKEVEQQTSLQSPESRIVAPAFVPEAPSFPKKKLILLIAIAAGLALGGGGICLLEYLESGFTAAAQIEQTLDLPILAMVPMLDETERNIDGRIAPIPRYAALKPQTRFGESIRSARMMTQISNAGQPPKLILVTSSISAEGKTTIAMSLALSAAASSKQRVLLIDCDLRAQSVTKQFNLSEKPGLTDLLTDRAPSEQAVFRTDTSNLSILPAGAFTSNPPDILGSDRLPELLRTLCESYDLIYMDAPPLLPVIDSVVLSKFADKVVFVVRWRTTPRNIAMRAVQLIEDPEHKISGIVFNGARLDQLASYDPYNTYHHKLYKAYYAS